MPKKKKKKKKKKNKKKKKKKKIEYLKDAKSVVGRKVLP